MRDRRAVVYGFAFKCDVCGFEEYVEARVPFDRLGKSGADSDSLATTRAWQNVRAYSFAAEWIDVCSEACYDKHVADYKDSLFRAVPA